MFLSLKSTLAALFAAMALVTALQGTATVATLRAAEKRSAAVATSVIPGVVALADLRGSVSRVRNKQYRVILSVGPDAIEASLTELIRAEIEVRDAQARYEALVPSTGADSAYATFASTWARYRAATAPLHAAALQGRPASTQAFLFDPDLRALWLLCDTSLGRAAVEGGERADAIARADQAFVQRAVFAAMGYTGGALLLALAAMVFSYRRVLRPIAQVTEAMREVARGGEPAPQRAPPRRDEIGVLVEALGLVHDSTRRARLAEDARDQSQLFMQNIAAAASDGIIGIDQDGVVTFFNAAAERLLGFPAAQVLGRDADLLRARPQALDRRQAMDERLARVGRTVEADLRHRNGSLIPVELTYGAWIQNGRQAFCVNVRDIRLRRAQTDVLNRFAYLDALTGLPNRLRLSERIAGLLARQDTAALLLMDLDRFKQVNDTFGHATGDAVLRETASRLRACTGPDDMVSRLGGDEFVILLPGRSRSTDASTVAARAIACLSAPFTVDGRTLTLGASVGVALAPTHAATAETLLNCADLALYAAKNRGRQCFHLFTPDLGQAASSESVMRQQLAGALERDEFRLVFQPVVRLADQEVVGAKALLQWSHGGQELLAEDRFLPILESGQQGAAVGDWMVDTVCRHAALWRAGRPAFRVGVTLPPGALSHEGLADRVLKTLTRWGLPGSALEVEISEAAILRPDTRLISALKQLKDAGVGVAIDPRATASAPLSLLERFPMTCLKVDAGSPQDPARPGAEPTLLRAALLLSRAFGLEVTADGLATVEQAQRLRRRGCLVGRGDLFGPAVPPDRFADMLAGGGPDPLMRVA